MGSFAGVRYVEVKARAQSGAMRLSSNEWKRARHFGEKLWLYVVTEAGTDQPELHRIRTPTDWMPRDASDERQLLGATAASCWRRNRAGRCRS